jgi:hypothetical protein
MAETFTVSGVYTFSLTTPTSSDGVDLGGSSSGFYKRGPTVPVPSIPNVNVSDLEVFSLNSSTGDLSTTVISLNSQSTIGISDPSAGSEPYYYIGAQINTIAAVPEPGPLLLTGIGALLLSGWYSPLVRRCFRHGREVEPIKSDIRIEESCGA